MSGPASADVPRYEVRIDDDGTVYVRAAPRSLP
jgi:hypothetical protein